ncbi:DUF11 domain-containing protein [Rhodopirellula halodulae]|uniref:DUF11 domain-containing protein n=1 Tax=Rhodopirellula halodulae TaxID=2894198 RepID=UPI001E2FA333|nr:DUF11 domain-containing protein [Rhodopirellula sp. JC737]MCC9655806.1 DUF11 domain-containing protein [Rhodopirellula sp. JC737]
MKQLADIALTANRSPQTSTCTDVVAWALMVVIAFTTFGCATPVVPPVAPANPVANSQAANMHAPQSSLPSPASVTGSPKTDSLDLHSLYENTHPAINQTKNPMLNVAESSVAQVGFRDRIACGCGSAACGGDCNVSAGDCVACQPAPMVPMMRAPWGVDPQEFLCDGGDHDPEAVLTRGDVIAGLQPEDTVTHYTTEAGDIEFAASNRVCVYSPRFASVRRITGAIQNDRSITVGGTFQPVGPKGVDLDLPGLVMTDTTELGHSELTRRVDAMRDRNRGVPVENVQQIEVAEDVLALLANIRRLSLSQLDESQLALIERFANAAVEWAIDESVEVEIQDVLPPTLTRDEKVDALVVYDFPEAGRLNLIKLADRQHAPIGDTVTFALRLQNVGDSPVSGIVVTDNLTTRLEYVADSQSASMKADFEKKPNQAGSDQLVWTLSEELAVGETVTIEFQCKVR